MKWEAALPKARDWELWLDHHWDRLKDGEPWQLFLVEALWQLSQSFVVMSRRLRKNPTWDASMGERDWEKISDVGEEKLAWFKKNRPSSLGVLRAPKWAVDIADVIEGMLKMQIRIGREIEAAQRTGFSVVNVNPLQEPHEFAGAEEEN